MLQNNIYILHIQTWKDWKMYVLKKETKRRNHGFGTGGGPPIKIPFSSLEEELLEFITPEAAGLENVPQGGINLNEEIDQDDVQIQDVYPEGKENILPRKRLCKHDQFLKLNNNIGIYISNVTKCYILQLYCYVRAIVKRVHAV